jgi:nitrogenase molybdenum-iron protein alpha/beta subunit
MTELSPVHVDEINEARGRLHAALARRMRTRVHMERVAILYGNLAAAYQSAAEVESDATWRPILDDAAAGMRSIMRAWLAEIGDVS